MSFEFLGLLCEELFVSKEIVRDDESLKFYVFRGENVGGLVILNEGVQLDVVVGSLNLLLALGAMVLKDLAQTCDVLYEFIKVILGEVNSGLFILLYLLKNRFIVIFHVKLCLIKLFNAILIIFKSCLHLVLRIKTLIHDFLYLSNG